MATVKVTDESFERDVLQAEKPVLVDFWAEWCGPCKQIGPALDQISEELADQLTVVKVNIDDNPMTPGRYGVRGIPTMMLFRDGQMASMKVGAMPKQKILEWLSEAGVPAAALGLFPPLYGEGTTAKRSGVGKSGPTPTSEIWPTLPHP